MVFRDQTRALAAKHAPSTESSNDSTAVSPTRRPSPPHTGQWSALDSGLLVFFESPKLKEDTGLIDFFTNNFTCTGTLSSRSNLFWVPGNFDDLLKHDTARFSVLAVGAMALARLQRSPHYLREAQKMYSTAALSLTDSWKNIQFESKEAIYIAVSFLSFFEVLALYDPSSRQSWMTHLQGIGGLLQSKEGRPVPTDFTVHMLLQSRSQVIMYALQNKTPVRGIFASGDLPILRVIPPRLRASDDLDSLLIRLAGLQAQAQSPQIGESIVNSLKTLQLDLVQWSQNVPTFWSFSRRDCLPSGLYWWEQRCDVYPTGVVANVWNKYRVARIIIHDLLAAVSSETTQATLHRFRTHTATTPTPSSEIQQLATDVCATIPMYYRPPHHHARWARESQDQPLLGTTYWLLWVLQVVGSMKEAPAELTLWIQKCLERIFNCTGIMVAQRVAAGLQLRLASLRQEV